MKIFLDTIGCRLNQAEIESFARQFRAAGHVIVPTASEADLAVVNTCTVTSEAASDSRAAIRRAKRLGAGEIIVTGCWTTLEPDKAAELEGVTRVVPNAQKENLAADLLGLPHEFLDLEPLTRQPLPGVHQRTRVFIKAQDGCENTCTYCITRLARGSSRSRSVDEIVKEVNAAQNGGVQEVVLTGVHLGSWGQDLEPARNIPDLVSTLLAKTSVPRLRMSSLEPWDLEADFFNLWHDPRLCRHLHLPLQSGSAAVLKRMARKTTPESYTTLLESARSAIPEVAITTDVIAGFPGETDKEFVETLDFVRSMHFAGGHVFSYSPRPGTPASLMKGRVPSGVVKTRSAALRTVLVESAEAFHRKFIGRTMPVLWEARSSLSNAGWQIEGLTDNYMRVSAIAQQRQWNTFDDVLLKTANAAGLQGEIQTRNRD
jgi:threonylcarbamoyladenosine tRNA methylthiotransferase MtaB